MTKDFLLSFEPDGRGGFIVRDASARKYVVADQSALWSLLEHLKGDPTLPQVHVEKRNDVVGIVAGLARRVGPQKYADLVDVAEPMAHQATKLVPVLQRHLGRKR